MFLAGIQAEFELDPRLKHSGVTVFAVVRSIQPGGIFKAPIHDHELGRGNQLPLTFPDRMGEGVFGAKIFCITLARLRERGG